MTNDLFTVETGPLGIRHASELVLSLLINASVKKKAIGMIRCISTSMVDIQYDSGYIKVGTHSTFAHLVKYKRSCFLRWHPTLQTIITMT